jgi:hypothetical protein
MKTLLEMGADVNVRNNEGDLCMHIVARNNSIEGTKLVLLYDDMIGRVNWAHMTPLGVTRMYGNKDVESVILRAAVKEKREFHEAWDYEVEQQQRCEEEQGSKEHTYVQTGTQGVHRKSTVINHARVVELREKKLIVPMRRRVPRGITQGTVTSTQYRLDAAALQQEIKQYKSVVESAIIIQSCGRRQIARQLVRRWAFQL